MYSTFINNNQFQQQTHSQIFYKKYKNAKTNKFFPSSLSPSLKPITNTYDLFTNIIKNNCKSSPTNSNSSISTINSDTCDIDIIDNNSTIINICNNSKIAIDLIKYNKIKTSCSKLEKLFY